MVQESPGGVGASRPAPASGGPIPGENGRFRGWHPPCVGVAHRPRPMRSADPDGIEGGFKVMFKAITMAATGLLESWEGMASGGGVSKPSSLIQTMLLSKSTDTTSR